ncbi:hypothetical protein BCR43DRAFT_522522 [Syncephalastrum racemosum]|uniref:Uncharacterized protein n=1 Tax=Syncephalastrum racemosum TaxID=13706 RepID=A0A1X2HQS2_SYNRA|nr:hypothetical protein BCR43DRAFT_522522 [Syncephalastrum racemosum]
MSAHIQSDASMSVDMGPESSALPDQVDPHTARILYRTTAVEEFKYAMKPCELQTTEHIDGTAGKFNNDQLMPATVFTVYDLPHNMGYGTGANALGKLTSRFLQALAIAIMNTTTTKFDQALESFMLAQSNMSKDKTSDSWTTMENTVERLRVNLEKGTSNPCEIASAVNFSALATEASKAVVPANARIRKDVISRLKILYGD